MNSRNPKADKLIRTNIKQNKRGETISGAVGQRFESSLAYISSFYGRLSLFNLPYNGFWSKYDDDNVETELNAKLLERLSCYLFLTSDVNRKFVSYIKLFFILTITVGC